MCSLCVCTCVHCVYACPHKRVGVRLACRFQLVVVHRCSSSTVLCIRWQTYHPEYPLFSSPPRQDGRLAILPFFSSIPWSHTEYKSFSEVGRCDSPRLPSPPLLLSSYRPLLRFPPPLRVMVRALNGKPISFSYVFTFLSNHSVSLRFLKPQGTFIGPN